MDIALCFSHPANIIIAGPTKSGKTTFVSKLLQYQLIDPFPTRLVLVYSCPQPIYQQWRAWYPQLEMIEGFNADIATMFDRQTDNLLILDDQMTAAGAGNDLIDLFTRVSHHSNLTIIYLVQNIFPKGPSQRTASLNASNIVLFQNSRDRQQIDHLSREMYPGHKHYLPQVLEDLTKEWARAYLVTNFDNTLPPEARVYTGIFPGEQLRFFEPGSIKGGGSRKRKHEEVQAPNKCRVINLIEVSSPRSATSSAPSQTRSTRSKK